MKCAKATKSYEAWLAKHVPVIEADLQFKHQQMKADLFAFMRATFYRWIDLWNEHCLELAKAPTVLAVGDLHVENFGTWRDQEGRMVWGINDFDESFTLPYTNDLVRLAVSAHLAISAHRLEISPADACAAIVNGYRQTLNDEGHPFILAEHHDWLRSTVLTQLRDPAKFWQKLGSLEAITDGVPNQAKKVLAAALPGRHLQYRIVHRVSGLGSLGRPRFAALAEWNGSLIAREIKALLPSACVWARGMKDGHTEYDVILKQAVRSPDPFQELRKGWVVRRLAPDCSRVELSMLGKGCDECKLLEAMGREAANIHLGSRRAIEKVKRDLNKRPEKWLHVAAKSMVRATTEDWQSWCAFSPKEAPKAEKIAERI